MIQSIYYEIIAQWNGKFLGATSNEEDAKKFIAKVFNNPAYDGYTDVINLYEVKTDVIKGKTRVISRELIGQYDFTDLETI